MKGIYTVVGRYPDNEQVVVIFVAEPSHRLALEHVLQNFSFEPLAIFEGQHKDLLPDLVPDSVW